ncbi:hypothetical protein HT031_005856 [Scenedesmus sp. PABB004]|nr:hypothetical protein HT031_005856 [Scenedesmus sp. PABB004]
MAARLALQRPGLAARGPRANRAARAQLARSHSPGPQQFNGGSVDSARLAVDPDKEESRKYRRTVFDHEHWAHHRTTGRYARHMATALDSYIVRGLAGPLAYVAGVALAVTTYEHARDAGGLPGWPSLALDTLGPFSLSTFALSLLLAYRTNASYQRWCEARKLWGAAINRTRDLARQATQWSHPTADAGLAAAMCRWTAAFPYALAASLRQDMDLAASLRGVLAPHEAELVLRQPHAGTAVLQALGAYVRASCMREAHKLRIDENITALQDIMGGCERIFKTPIPLCYSRHTSRFIVCWTTLLPLCLVGSMHFGAVPASVVLAFFLYGIDEVGVQTEEPFSILALESFCATIADNVRQAEQAAGAARAAAEAEAAGPAPGQPALADAAAALVAASGGSTAAGSGPLSVRSTLVRVPGSGFALLVSPGDAERERARGAALDELQLEEEGLGMASSVSGAVGTHDADYTFS